MVVNEGNTLDVLDVEARRRLGFHRRVAPGDGWDYASRRIITEARFVSGDMVEFQHCDRRQTIADDGRDFSGCGADRRTLVVRLVRTSSGVSANVVGQGNDLRRALKVESGGGAIEPAACVSP